METLLKLCCNKLRSSFSLWPYSYNFEIRSCIESVPRLSDLKQDIDDFIGDNFHKIIGSSQFQEFSESDLTKFLSLDSLNVDEEDEVFDCLVVWVHHNPEKRKELLPQLLNLIRIPLFSKHKLFSLFTLYPDIFKAAPRAGDRLILVVTEENNKIQLKCFDIKVGLILNFVILFHNRFL